MSATNRGAKRVPNDVYSTPAWAVRALLKACDLPGGIWMEPAAGEGALIQAARPMRPDVTWLAIDIRESCWRTLDLDCLVHDGAIGDFRKIDWSDWDAPNVIITNPPFSLAEAFVRKALEVPGAVVVMLLRLNWLAGQHRAKWLREHTPSVYVLPMRPRFGPSKKHAAQGKLDAKDSDATDYGWMVWGMHKTPQVEILRLEDCR